MTGSQAEGIRDIGRAWFPLAGDAAPVVLHTELTGSTQDDLAELWREGAVPPGTAMIADDQTAAAAGSAGRGTRIPASPSSSPF